MAILLQEVTCRWCGAHWFPRTQDPKRCPSCKRYDPFKKGKGGKR